MKFIAAGYVPYLVVASAMVSFIGFSLALVAFTPTSPKATWAVNPLSISFSATTGPGSASDFLSCTPGTGPVQLIAKNSVPSRLMLTITPAGVVSCGSIPSAATVTATCRVSADLCKGSYSGQVQVRQPSNYRNLPDDLKVMITVT